MCMYVCVVRVHVLCMCVRMYRVCFACVGIVCVCVVQDDYYLLEHESMCRVGDGYVGGVGVYECGE